jgi:hypothetical protein
MGAIEWSVIGLIVLWLVANAKSSRPDGDVVKKIHPYRKMLGYIMPSRNGSVVYYDEYVNVEALEGYLEKAREKFNANMTHCLVAACAVAMAENPKMNQFVSGRRLYKRRGAYLTFSMKRQKLNKEAKLSAVKMKMDEGETFKDLCDRINGQIKVERSGEKTYADKELGLFAMIPRAILEAAVRMFFKLDYYNLLPKSFIENDGMFTSIFIANLGSLNMRAGFHHLFEWGNCPLFMMVGRAEEKPVVVDGEVKVQKQLHIRWTYDERIDDGLTASHGMATVNRVLENPYESLGCLEEDGSDKHQLKAQAA